MSLLEGFVTDEQLKRELVAMGIPEPSDRALRDWRRKGLLPYARLGKHPLNDMQGLLERLASGVKKKRRA